MGKVKKMSYWYFSKVSESMGKAHKATSLFQPFLAWLMPNEVNHWHTGDCASRG